MRRLLAYGVLLIVGIAVACGMLEVFFRMYDPFGFRVRGGQIVLPVNRRYVIKNTEKIPGLDVVIHHTKNSFGFRGAEPPDDLQNVVSIIAVGGSTTEQFYLSDNDTWVDLLGKRMAEAGIHAWVNNAGLDGHSTFGHRALLEQHLVALKPRIILFLVGVNEIGRIDLTQGDRALLTSRKSAFVDAAVNIARVLRARRLNVQHSFVDVRTMPQRDVSKEEAQKRIDQEASLVQAYDSRLRALVEITKEAGIIPVLITQSMLWGDARDVATQVDLARPALHDGMNGALYGKLLALYNEKTREVGRALKVVVIDLAGRMPHDSLLYYDGIHFSKAGAEKVSDILWTSLKTSGLF